MKPTGLKLARRPNVKTAGDEDYWRHPQDPQDAAGEDANWRHPQDPMDPAPRKPAYADQGGPDFDPTDESQKPEGYDQYSEEAYQDFASIVSSGPDDSYNSSEIDEWRKRWMERAAEMGMDERQASQALDDIQDGY